MPNGTYGGVRGRKTKVGGKPTTFVFLLLYSGLALFADGPNGHAGETLKLAQKKVFLWPMIFKQQ